MSEKNIKPGGLVEGDTIGVICPSSPIMPDDKHTAYQYLEQRGIHVKVAGQCYEKIGYNSGTREQRLEAIHRLVEEDGISAIMSFWGGTNSNQLLEDLDFDLIRRNPKVFVGYSDSCALGLAITHKTGLITFMGPGVITFAKPEPYEFSWNAFKAMCFASSNNSYLVEDPPYYSDDLYFLNPNPTKREKKINEGRKVFRHGEAQGEIIASNLQTLLTLTGTEYFPDLKDKIIFLEESEIFEARLIHRFFTHCRQLGMFRQAKALVIGKFMAQTGFNDQVKFSDILDDVLRDTDVPVIYDVDFGHTDPLITVPNGGNCYINTQKGLLVLGKSVKES
jgi:muramoyltetrapeptide carboxypeptidase